jgi:pimeloyl-ACP methyl ester carboxylesterase
LALGYLVGCLKAILFACALEGGRLYAAQVAALEADYECTVFAFRDNDSLGGIAEELLARTLARFTLIGLSLGGYLAFEIVRLEPRRLERLILMDTTAAADHPANAMECCFTFFTPINQWR